MTEPVGCTTFLGLLALLLATLFGGVVSDVGIVRPDAPPPPEACTVQTDQPEVAVRVGPGINRAIRQYLPSNQALPVSGRATAADGSLWWQVEIAGVDQAWVMQSDVVPAGACTLIADADAPPVILVPPTPAPQPTSTPMDAEAAAPPNNAARDTGQSQPPGDPPATEAPPPPPPPPPGGGGTQG
ncbi:MAG: hypothetical protein JXN59_18650 [Anaerolineae bacterium]|nr:hypothetical protein [Anaerolineae bacterium]